MSILNISSANSALRCVVPNLYPQGFEIDDFSADEMFNTDVVSNAEVVMGADGILHAGQIFNLVPFSINIMPSSQAGFYIEDWFNYETSTGVKLPCNLVLVLDSIGRKYNYVDGVLMSFPLAPPAGRILQPRTAIFNFRSVIGSTT